MSRTLLAAPITADIDYITNSLSRQVLVIVGDAGTRRQLTFPDISRSCKCFRVPDPTTTLPMAFLNSHGYILVPMAHACDLDVSTVRST